MGWWSADILGGDSPLDAVGEFEKEIGWDYDDSGFIYKPTSKAFAKKMLTRSSSKNKAIELFKDYKPAEILAITEVFLLNEVKVTKSIYEAALKAVAEDEWGLEGDRERLRILNDFKVRLEANRTGTTPKLQKFRIGMKVEIIREAVFEVEATSEQTAREIAHNVANSPGTKVIKESYNRWSSDTKPNTWYEAPFERRQRITEVTVVEGTPADK